MEKIKKNKTENLAVLIIFFCRTEPLKKVFEQVKKVKPQTLLLYQDGARANSNDLEGIIACREIVKNIDWECNVKMNYQENNSGCDPSVYNAVKWAFSHVESCVVLEDDCVPAVSFFYFCEEMLNIYKDDKRVNMISGRNNKGVHADCESDYFFSKNVGIWGWATWKRVIDNWDPTYSILDNKKALEQLRINFDYDYDYKRFIKLARKRKHENIAYHETINALSMYSNNQLNIVSKVNMIENVGVGENGTHTPSDLKFIPKNVRKLYFLEKHEINSNIRHPKYFIRDHFLDDKLTKRMVVLYYNKIAFKILKLIGGKK